MSSLYFFLAYLQILRKMRVENFSAQIVRNLIFVLWIILQMWMMPSFTSWTTNEWWFISLHWIVAVPTGHFLMSDCSVLENIHFRREFLIYFFLFLEKQKKTHYYMSKNHFDQFFLLLTNKYLIGDCVHGLRTQKG